MTSVDIPFTWASLIIRKSFVFKSVNRMKEILLLYQVNLGGWALQDESSFNYIQSSIRHTAFTLFSNFGLTFTWISYYPLAENKMSRSSPGHHTITVFLLALHKMVTSTRHHLRHFVSASKRHMGAETNFW